MVKRWNRGETYKRTLAADLTQRANSAALIVRDDKHGTLFVPCLARRESDEMVCHKCGIRWSVDEDKPESAKCR